MTAFFVQGAAKRPVQQPSGVATSPQADLRPAGGARRDMSPRSTAHYARYPDGGRRVVRTDRKSVRLQRRGDRVPITVAVMWSRNVSRAS